MAQIIANFEEANPDIEIVLETLNVDVMRDIAKPSMEAGEGPDIIYYDAGPGNAGILANAGLLLPLDAAYDANNWDERLISISRAWTTFGGHVYGVGHELEAQGLYWNKRIFAEEELELPATFAGLVELCGTLRERGYEAPIAIGWGDPNAFPLLHNWYNILANYVPADTVAAMISGEHPFSDPEVVASIELVTTDMVDAGCYHDDAYAIGFLDGNNMLYAGESPLMLMSTWAMGFFTDEVTDEFGFHYLAAHRRPAAGDDSPDGLGLVHRGRHRTPGRDHTLPGLSGISGNDPTLARRRYAPSSSRRRLQPLRHASCVPRLHQLDRDLGRSTGLPSRCADAGQLEHLCG